MTDQNKSQKNATPFAKDEFFQNATLLKPVLQNLGNHFEAQKHLLVQAQNKSSKSDTPKMTGHSRVNHMI